MSAHQPVIVRAAAKLMIPVIVVFGVYAHMNAMLGVGGGFVGGLLIASALMLYGLVFGVDEARRAVPAWVLRGGAGLGLIAFLLVGAIGAFHGKEFLDYTGLSASPGPRTQRLGAGLAQAASLLSTASVFALMFYAIAGRAADLKDDAW